MIKLNNLNFNKIKAFLLNMIIHLLTEIKKKITEQFYFQNNLYF